MKIIYFDTEFTNLSDSAQLISIGLVEDNGIREFYAELSEGYSVEDCSEFCKKDVLIHLEGTSREMTIGKLKKNLWQWLESFQEPVLLVSDSSKDADQLLKLFPDGLPLNCNAEILGWVGNLQRQIFNRGRRLHKKNGLRVHHALDDAKVNRMILGVR